MLENHVKEANKISWNNDDNANFYESISVEKLRQFAIQGGFENGCDVELIWPYICRSQKILVVGAGYGREIHHILNRGFRGEIWAIERSKNFCKYLNDTYGDQIKLTNADIRENDFSVKFDLIISLWSGISDFPKDKQLFFLKHLVKYLQKDGYIILETLLHSITPVNSSVAENQFYIIPSENCTVYGYIPSADEINDYAKALHLNAKHIPYLTQTNRQRVIHILSRNDVD